MGKVVRVVIGIVAIIIILPLLLLGALYVTVDFNSLKKDITQQVSATLGRDIVLNGPIGISFDHGIALSASDVRIGNPANYKEKDFIKAEKISVALNWQALAQHRVDIQQVTVHDATINMITNAASENNWDIKLPKSTDPAPAKTPATTEAKNDFKIERVDLSAIDIVKTTVRQRDERKNTVQELVVEKASIKAPFGGALNIGAQGSYNKTPFTFELTAPGGLQDLNAGKPSLIDVKADYAGQSYAIKATYTHGEKTHDLKNLQAKALGIEFNGNLTVRSDGDVPMISGALSALEINLLSLGKKTAQVKSRAVVQSLVMMDTQAANMIVAASAAPDFRALKAVNANVALTITKLVVVEGKPFENVKTTLLLNNGRLQLQPFTVTFLNVAYKGSLDFNASGEVPVTRLVLAGDNIDFAALAAAFNSKSPLAANGDLDLDITGQGTTPGAFKNSLSGKIQMTAGKGAIDLGSSGATGINLIKMLYPKTQASEKQNINCGVVRFNADNGMLRSNGILFDSPLAAVVGEGSVDLAQDNANLVFRHAVKDTQAGSFLNVPIKATGPLAHLTFRPEEGAVLQKAMSALNGNGSTSSGVPRVDPNAKGNACLATINDPHPVMLDQMKTQDAVKATINQAKDVIKNIGKPEEAINKLKGLFGR